MMLIALFIIIDACYGAIQYPINFHGHHEDSQIHCFDTDPSGNLVYGGETKDELMTDVANSGTTRAFLVYQRYSDQAWLWHKYYTRDAGVTPKRVRVRTAVSKFTKVPIVGQGNTHMVVAAYMPENVMDKIELDFIVPTPAFNLLGSYQVLNAINGAALSNLRVNMGTVFVRTITNSANTAQIIEVYLITYQSYNWGPGATQGNLMQFERVDFTVPLNGAAPTVSSTFFNGGPDGTQANKFFTASSIIVKDSMIYVGLTFEYNINDNAADPNNNQGYGIWRTNVQLDNTFNRIDGNTCKVNVLGFGEDPPCSRWNRIVRIMSMDYFDRLTAFTAHTKKLSQESEEFTRWHDFIFQCNGIGSTDQSQFLGDTFKTMSMNTQLQTYKRFIGMYHKDATNVYGLLQDSQNQKIYFIQVTINSVTDCNTFSVDIKNKQLVEFFGPNEKVNGLHAQFIYNSVGGEEQEMAISGFATSIDWCNNGYNPNAPNGKQFGYIGAITYKCGSFLTMATVESQTVHEHYYNKFDVATKQVGVPLDVKTDAMNGLKDMTLTVGTTITKDFTGCVFCCYSIRDPGAVQSAGRYPDQIFYATTTTNKNVFSTDIRDFFTFSDEINCPATSCQMKSGILCDQVFTSGTSNIKPQLTGTGMSTQVEITHNPSLLSASLTLPVSDDICIYCSHAIDYGFTEQFKVTLDCGTVSGTINGEPLTTHNQQFDVEDIGSTNEPPFIFKQFTNSMSLCPVESYCVSSTNTDPCTLHSKLKSSTQNFVDGPTQYEVKLNNYHAPDVVTFYIKVSARSSNGPRYIYTSAMTLTLVCGPLSTQILGFSYYFDTFQVRYPSKDASFIFYPFKVSNENCPVTSHQLTASPIAVITPTNGLKSSVELSGTSGLSVAPIDPLTDEKEYKFYIKITAQGGAQKWSDQFTLRIDAKCNEQSLGFSYPQKKVVLVQNSTELRPHVVDVSKMFYTGDELYCPILGYEISKVFDGQKWLSSWDKKIQFDKQKAILTFNDTNELIERWELYIVAKTKAKTSLTDTWPVSFQVVAETNFKPFLIDFEGSITINIAEFLEGSRTRYRYKIPQTFDPNRFDSVNVTVVDPSEPFMKVDYNLMMIYFDDLTLENLGTYEISFLLEDDDKVNPKFNDEYTLIVKIVCENTEYFGDCSPNKTQETKSQPVTQEVQTSQQIPTNKLWANITSLTESGLLTIKFRDYMQTSKFGEFNQTQLAKYFNNDTFSIYVIRYDDDDYDLKYYNLSFYCVNYFQDEMQLQIDFDHPLWISQQESRDILHVYLKNHTYFRSNYTRSRNMQVMPQFSEEEFEDEFNLQDIDSLFDEQGREYEFVLSLNYTNLRVRIPKQMPVEMKPYLEINEEIAYNAQLVILLGFVLAFILFRICWILLITGILSLQVVAHLPQIRVVLPANVIMIYRDIIPIASFDWLGFDFQRTRWVANSIFTYTKQDEYPVLFEQPRDLGWNTNCLALILGSYLTLWAIYFLRVVYLALFRSCLESSKEALNEKVYKGLDKYLTGTQNSLCWFNLIMLAFISLYELLLGGYLNLSISITSSSGDIFSSYLTIVLFVIITLIALPLITFHVLSQDIQTLESKKDFKTKYGAFWWRQPIRNKGQLAYSVVFMLRRVAHICIVLKIEIAWIQLFATIGLNYAVCMYYGNFKPKKNKLEYKMELFNEIMIYVITYHLLLLSDWIPDPEVRYFYGWSMCLSIIFMIAINFLIITFLFAKCSVLMIIKFIQWIRIVHYLINLKYNHLRIPSNEEEPNVSIIHVMARKLLFQIGFFYKENKYECKDDQLEYRVAIDDCIREIQAIKFGFAYQYPLSRSNELPMAKTAAHAQIRSGYERLLCRRKPVVVVKEEPKEFHPVIVETIKQEEPKIDPKLEEQKNLLNDIEKPRKKAQLTFKSLFDYNKILKMGKPQMPALKQLKPLNQPQQEEEVQIPTILDQERTLSDNIQFKTDEDIVKPKPNIIQFEDLVIPKPLAEDIMITRPSLAPEEEIAVSQPKEEKAISQPKEEKVVLKPNMGPQAQSTTQPVKNSPKYQKNLDINIDSKYQEFSFASDHNKEEKNVTPRVKSNVEIQAEEKFTFIKEKFSLEKTKDWDLLSFSKEPNQRYSTTQIFKDTARSILKSQE